AVNPKLTLLMPRSSFAEDRLRETIAAILSPRSDVENPLIDELIDAYAPGKKVVDYLAERSGSTVPRELASHWCTDYLDMERAVARTIHGTTLALQKEIANYDAEAIAARIVQGEDLSEIHSMAKTFGFTIPSSIEGWQALFQERPIFASMLTLRGYRGN